MQDQNFSGQARESQWKTEKQGPLHSPTFRYSLRSWSRDQGGIEQGGAERTITLKGTNPAFNNPFVCFVPSW
jgi:hypothetical protein